MRVIWCKAKPVMKITIGEAKFKRRLEVFSNHVPLASTYLTRFGLGYA